MYLPVGNRGYTALKTNIVLPGGPAEVYFGGFGSGPDNRDSGIDGVSAKLAIYHPTVTEFRPEYSFGDRGLSSHLSGSGYL